MQLIRSLQFQDNADVGNRYAKINVDFDLETEWELTLNGTDDNGDLVRFNFVAIDNYVNDNDVTIQIDDIGSVVASFTKVIWQVNPLVQTVRLSADAGEITVWVSEKKLPIGEGINEHGEDTVAATVLRANTRNAVAAIASAKADMGVYLTEVGREGLFSFKPDDYSTQVASDPNQGLFIAPTSDATGTNGAWVRTYSGEINLKWFGAKADGGAIAPAVPTDNLPMINAALAALRAFNLNPGGVGSGAEYKGSPELKIPGGHYYFSSTIFVNHTVIIRGEGSGRMPAGAYGCTHLRWPDGVCGIVPETPNTSNITVVDVGAHDGSGGCYIKNMTLEGGYAGVDSASHAIVMRPFVFLDDVLIRKWSGTGVHGWTGNVVGNSPPAYGGNISVSRLTGVKVEGCYYGFDLRGTDSNVITVENCEGYQNRVAGFVDDNGAGSNTYIGCHCTFNGLTGQYSTQVSHGGNLYAVLWGQEAWCKVNAPSGTTDDNTGWIYVGAGGVDASHVAWVNGMNGLASGGDYVMLSNFATVLLNCYMEGGGFSQLGPATLTLGGTGVGQASIGGSNLNAAYDGLTYSRRHSAAVFHCVGTNGAANGIDSVDVVNGQVGGLWWSSQGSDIFCHIPNGLGLWSLNAGVPSAMGRWNTGGITLQAAMTVTINGNKVLDSRSVRPGVPTLADVDACLQHHGLWA